MGDDWTKDESRKALRHIETANYELGVLIDKVGEIHGDVKIMKSTIENEIRPDIRELKKVAVINSGNITKLEKKSIRFAGTFQWMDRMKWIAVGTGFTVLAAVAVYYITRGAFA